MATKAPAFRISPRSLEVLEWTHIQSQLARRADTPFGQDLCRGWLPGRLTRERAQLQARSILELIDLHVELNRGLPLKDIPEVSDILRRIERSGAISVEEFADFVRFHRATQALYHYLHRYALTKKAVLQYLSDLDLLESWSRRYFPLLDSKGEIADSASEDLRALRKLAVDLHKKVQDRLKDYLNNPKLTEVMQEFYVTVRDGRYVIPVKAQFRGRVAGIIHDVSSTEATLFIEPQEVVEANNQLKVVEKEIQAEIEKILKAVVEGSREHVHTFRKNLSVMAQADLLQAAAGFVQDWKGPACQAEWTAGHDLDFSQLRHPLLALHRKVVSNSVSWKQGLVLSGPNTGGKTVLLKSVGCALCLAWAGLPIPAQEARIPEGTGGLAADIGDDQNLEKNLSTFSAHLAVLKDILQGAQGGDLVLIDEIATGTSPEEGEPLAQAILERFLRSGVLFLVTTHYKGVKHFAMSDERVRIAAMAFDRLTKTPTYEILLDIPGESSALETAEQLGLDTQILERARELRGEVSEDMTRAIERLERARGVFESKERELAKEQKKTQDENRRLQATIAEYQEKQRAGLAQEAKSVLKDLQALREELAQAVKSASSGELSAGGTALFSKISEAGDTVRSVMEEARKDGLAPAAQDADIAVDAVLEIEGLGLGTVLEVPKDLERNSRALVQVQVGDLKTRVVKSRLRRPSTEKIRTFETHRSANLAAKERHLERATQGGERLAGKNGAQNLLCDVRGKSVEEAMRRVEQALNELFRNDQVVITCIHGHGSDRLKESLREYLTKERPDVLYRSGSWPGEGGDGVTIIERR